MEKILVSSCLLGANCRYDGKSNLSQKIDQLKTHASFIPVCPEVSGGLPIPRIKAERCGQSVINKDGIDCTAQFIRGAHIALDLAKKHNIRFAVLKSHSPSCGNHQVYDGTFQHILVNRLGVTAELLQNHGITIFNETEIDSLLDILKNSANY